MSSALSLGHSHWQHHIDAWQSSGLSQCAYCREHNLVIHQFSYWKAKLTKAKASQVALPRSGNAFVPVVVDQSSSTSSGLTVHLPNGCLLSGIEAHHLNTVTSLLAVLR